MNASLTEDMSVASIATKLPGAAGVFERLGIDYCCGGNLPLAQACRKRGLDAGDVMARLGAAAGAPDPTVRDWAGAGLGELADHIESTHHQYLKDELPRLRQLSQKVARVHGDAHGELRTLALAFERFADDMVSHMEKEEGVLFPLVRSLEQGRPAESVAIDGPIRCLTDEHEDAGRALEQFRSLTNGFAPPMGACNSWRVLLSDLQRLERDMHEHVHEENNILFPRALALEASRRGVA